MKCKEVLSLLSAYVDNELSVGDKNKIEAHLKECKGCSDSLNGVKETLAFLKELKEVPVPSRLSDRIKLSLRQEQRANRQNRKPLKWQQRFFPRRAISHVLIFAGALAVIIAVAIPLRAFWPLRTPTAGSKMEKTLTVQDRVPVGAKKDSTEKEEDESFDSLPVGEKVRETRVNYKAEGVKKLLDFYKRQEKEKEDSEVFSSELRNQAIANMLDEAKELKLNVGYFAQCFDVLMQQNENMVPVYAEKTRFQSQEVWMIVVKEFPPEKKGFNIKSYVLGTQVCKIIYSTD